MWVALDMKYTEYVCNVTQSCSKLGVELHYAFIKKNQYYRMLRSKR